MVDIFYVTLHTLRRAVENSVEVVENPAATQNRLGRGVEIGIFWAVKENYCLLVAASSISLASP